MDFDEVSSKVNSKNVKVINLLTNDIELKIDEILSCEAIISSSLHGVILGHAYKIPSIWVKFSKKLYGDDIKFYDYFESVKLQISKPLFMYDKIEEKSLQFLFEEYKKLSLPNEFSLKELKENLMNSCPFKS